MESYFVSKSLIFGHEVTKLIIMGEAPAKIILQYKYLAVLLPANNKRRKF
ncbi:hypothetical protein [Arachidicoccus ginsenosidivorans]|nr:hypothetical protein [Arachidicoccus ginsenosidivorans]